MTTLDDLKVRKAIATAKAFHAVNAREAAEMTFGRSLSDADWVSLGEPWTRNWSVAGLSAPEDAATVAA